MQRAKQDRTATCRNLLTGEALATWTIPSGELQRRVSTHAAMQLGRPAVRVRVTTADGGRLPERLTWAELFGE